MWAFIWIRISEATVSLLLSSICYHLTQRHFSHPWNRLHSTLSSSICCMEMKAYHLSLTTPSKAFVCVCVCVFYFLICHEQIHLTVAEDTNISVPCIVSTTDFSFGFSPVRNLIVAKWPGAKATNLYPGNDNFWLFCPNHNCILNGYFYSLYFESHSRDVFSLTKSLAAACLKENSLSLPQKSCYLHHAQ